MGRGALFSLAAILLLAHAPSAASPSPANACGPLPCAALEIGLIALIISINVAAIGYIISKLFPEAGLDDWLKGEYWEILKSAMLLVGILSAITFISNIAGTLVTPPTGTCPGTPPSGGLSYALANEACGYLSSVQGDLGNTFSYLFGLVTTLGPLQTVQVGAYLPIPLIFVGFKFGFDMHPYQNNLLESAGGKTESILNGAIEFVAFPVALLIAAQSSLMYFIYSLGLVVLLPLGLILRAMPFLRGIGGTLVGLAVGTSLIYPSVLILFNYPITAQLAAALNFAPATGSCTNFLICGPLSFILGLFSGISATGTALASTLSIYPALDGITNSITYLLLQFVLFILDLSIVYSLANGIAGLLGGQLELSITKKISLT